MPKRRVLLPATVLATSALAAPPALAAFPGTNGTIFYTQNTTTPLGRHDVELHGDIRAIAPDGTADRGVITTKRPSESEPAPSPDGQRLAFIRNGTLVISNIDGTNERPVAVKGSHPDMPAWSPDGRQLYFSDDERGIGVFDLGATYLPAGQARTIIAAKPFAFTSRVISIPAFPLVTPDGKSLVYAVLTAKVSKKMAEPAFQTWTAPTSGTAPRRITVTTPPDTLSVAADISPDGRQLAVVSSRNLNTEARRIWITNLDGSGTKLLATAARKSHYDGLSWSPDGSQIVLSRNESSSKRGGALESVAVATGAVRTIKRIPKGTIGEVKWQTLPAA